MDALAPWLLTDAEPVGAPEHWFDDVSEAAGVTVDRVPAEGFSNFVDRIGGGVCVIDVDGVAPRDLFFAMRPWADGGSLLYVGAGPLAFRDETAARGLSDVGDAIGCLAFDSDGDGDEDLLVTGVGTLRLFENDGGDFRDVSATIDIDLPPRDTLASAAAADLDFDGDLDLVVAGDFKLDLSAVPPDCPGCAVEGRFYEAVPSYYLERTPTGYRDATAEVAPTLSFPEPTLTLHVGDVDGDGRPDIYVGNDIGGFYRNRVLVLDGDGVYRDRAPELGLDQSRVGWGICTMGLSVGDVDRDQRVDYALTSFERQTSSIFICPPGESCVDEGFERGTDVYSDTFRWGTALVDLDLDGWLDISEATGNVFTEREAFDRGFSLLLDQWPNLLHNNGDGTFRAVGPTPEDGRAERRSLRGIAVTDLDEDGRPDLVFAPARGRPLLLRNVRPSVGHWLKVRLVGHAPNTGAVGAFVDVVSDGQTYHQERLAGEGYLGNFDSRLFFGVREDGPVTVSVRWPGAGRTMVRDVALDQEITVVQPVD